MNNEKIVMAHGNGGILMHRLISDVFIKHFDTTELEQAADAAILNLNGKIQVAFTTDSYVVNPLFFPGGSIGSLAINGTVNDLSVMGAVPRFISCGFIIEEGFDIAVLSEIVAQMKQSADFAGVRIVTGDTKVVERGAAHRLFINTAGIGFMLPNQPSGLLSPGDKIIINGEIGDHGMAVMMARKEFGIESNLVSDCAALNRLIMPLFEAKLRLSFMRDPTRGGLATVLNECIHKNDSLGIQIHESVIPIKAQVQEICDLLGFDPLYIANEGKVVIISHPDDANRIIEILHNHPLGEKAAIIGEVTTKHPGKVILETHVSGHRIIDMLITDQFPRIC